MAKGNGKLPAERYRARLQIDRHELDVALMEQPAMYLEVQEAFILAASHRDELKVAVDEAHAGADERVRRKLGDEKTEARVKSGVARDEQYLASVAEYQEAKTEADHLQAMVAAFQERGRMLAKLADLYISGYWAQSSARGSERDLRDRRAEEGRAAMAASRKERAAR